MPLATIRQSLTAILIATLAVLPSAASAQGTERDRQREALGKNLLLQIDAVMRLPMGPRIATANGSAFGYPQPADLMAPESIGAMVLGQQLDGYALVRLGEFDGQSVPADWPRPMRVLFPRTPAGNTSWFLIRGTGRVTGKTETVSLGRSISVPLIEIKPALAFSCEQPYCAEYLDKVSLTALIERRFAKAVP